MKKVLMMGLMLLFGIGSVAAQQLEQAEEKYNAGVEKIKAKELVDAAVLLKESMSLGLEAGEEGAELVKDIQNLLPKVYMQVGVADAKLKKYDEAIVHLLVAEEMADKYNDVTTRRQVSRIISGIYMAKGADSFNNKDFAAALEVFEKGYKQDPSNVKLANLTAKTYVELGRLTEAVDLFNQVIKAGTENSRYATDAAEAQVDLDNAVLVAVAQAVEAADIDKAITLSELAPQSPQVALLVIQGANNTKKYDVVIARGEAAAELQTDPALKGDVNYFLGSAYNSRENKAKAIEFLSKVSAGQFVAPAKAAVTELKK